MKVFQELTRGLGVESSEIAFVGDDPEADVIGASKAGMQPIWTTYVLDRKIPAAPGVLPVNLEVSADDVPRISTWNDLLDLLELQ
ncbi:MAG: HAD hydrolase-like protein [Deltaproteobacteria bacterium]|nr:HAD hydrolase-like protein [Deltaproteobacteria bacterium]